MKTLHEGFHTNWPNLISERSLAAHWRVASIKPQKIYVSRKVFFPAPFADFCWRFIAITQGLHTLSIDEMDSPRSEKSDTRFSTPASELDDHRNLPSSLPRVLTLGTLNDNQGGPNPSRRGTIRASFNNDRTGIAPDMFPPLDTNQEPQYLARDFEQAIVDDDTSFALSTHGLTAESPVHRRRSLSSAVGRQGSLRVHNATDRTIRSRASSSSSRSESPPNSVKAFANPRLRERAGTVNSKAPSEHEYGPQRTISGGTHQRRPTFSDGNTNNLGLDSDDLAKQGSAEEDVCFPPSVEEQLRPNEIDYEVLDEFVVEYGRGRSSAAPDRRRRQSMSSQSRLPNIFKDLRPQGARQAIPKIIVPGLESESDKEDQLSGFDEKCDSGLALRPTISARQYSQYEPGRFSFFSSELDSTILAPDLGDLLLPGESFHDLFGRVPEEGVWWLDVLDPNKDEINAICKAFGIHPLTCEDIKTQEAREKVELFPRYYFVCFRSFDQRDKSSEDYMEPVSVYIVVFREGVLSFTFTPNQHAANVRKRIGKLRDYVALHSDWICYALM